MTQEQALAINRHIRKHPEWFFEHMLGVEMKGKQLEIVQSVMNNRVTTVRSCHAAGKSFTAACTAIWFLMAYPESIVVTTAPTWRQVKDILWREVATRFAKAKIPLAPKEPTATGLNISTNWYAVGLSTKDPDKFQGYHADSGHLLAITDEAAGMEEPIFEAIDAILTSEKCRLLMIGNPTSSSGTFRDSHKPAYPANKIKISAFDTPNFTANGIRNEDDLIGAIDNKKELKIVADYLISPIWVYERIKKWRIGSPMYSSRVIAEFPDTSENTLIPLSWIESACSDERLEKILGLNLSYPKDGMPDQDIEKLEKQNDDIRKSALAEYIKNQNTIQGVDVARFGSDSTVIQPRWGKIVGYASTYHKEDTMQTAGRVWSRLKNLPTESAQIDVIGLGAGVVDRLMELQAEQKAKNIQQWTRIIPVNVSLGASEQPKMSEQMEYANRRAELYWKLKDMFEDGDIYLMPDEFGKPPEDLMDELSSIEYKFMGNKIYIEEKKDMKKRLNGKSPDRADALMLTLENADVTRWDNDREYNSPTIVRQEQAHVVGQTPESQLAGLESINQPITSGIDQRY